MLLDNKRCLRGMAAVVILLLASGVRAQEELETVGLSVYTETARDIYIAGLLLPPDAVVNNLMLSPPPKAMEYRIATRRISSRGFSGTILLQAELGSGGRAPENAINALTRLKSGLKGSLKQGDRFVIHLDETDDTVFLLNGTELLRVADGSVFDFFFSGWVGEGSATTFREALLAGAMDPATRDRYNRLSPSRDRSAEVSTWPTDNADSGATATAAAPAGSPQPAQLATAGAAAGAAATAAGSAAAGAAAANPPVSSLQQPREVASAVSAPGQSAAQPAAGGSETATEKDNTAPQQVAMAEPQSALEELDAALNELDDREYQRQLRVYLSDVMRQVYGEVKYPRRAIKYNWEGRVELLARLDADGELIEVIVDGTSGHTGLDKAALSAVERAAPFPALTPVAREELVSEEGDSYIMAIPVTFALQR